VYQTPPARCVGAII